MVLGYYHLPDSIRILTIAIFIYSIVIAWFKDIPDMAGDQKFDIQTLSLRIGSKTVFIFGNTLLALVFVFLIFQVRTKYHSFYSDAYYNVTSINIQSGENRR